MRRTLTILILTTLSMLSAAEAADHYTKYKGDKRLGVERLKRAASKGRYLRTLAKILLATVYIREKRYGQAQKITRELVDEYPDNASFPAELKKLQKKTNRIA